MTKIYFSFLAFFIGATSHISAQDLFEGSILYKIEYSSGDASLENLSDALPETCRHTVKGKKSIFEQPIAGGGRHAIISDRAADSDIFLMFFMGREHLIHLNEEDMKNIQLSEELRFVEIGKTKMIEGYSCDLVLGITEMDTVKIFYTKELPTEANLRPFSNLDGMPLEYEISRGNMRMHYSAIAVEPKKVDPEIFVPDPDIREIEFSEFAKSFAKMQE